MAAAHLVAPTPRRNDFLDAPERTTFAANNASPATSPACLSDRRSTSSIGSSRARTGEPRRCGHASGHETTLGKTTLQRHLTALETGLVETAGTGLLTLVAATAGLAQALPMPRPTRLASGFGTGGRLDGIQSHLRTLPLQQVRNLVDHARVPLQYLPARPPGGAYEAQATDGRTMSIVWYRSRLDQRDLIFLVRHGYPMISSTDLPRLAAISDGLFTAVRPFRVARTTL